MKSYIIVNKYSDNLYYTTHFKSFFEKTKHNAYQRDRRELWHPMDLFYEYCRQIKCSPHDKL